MNTVEILQSQIEAKKNSIDLHQKKIETNQGIINAISWDIKRLEREIEKEKQRQSENIKINLSALQLVFIINGNPCHLVYIERNLQIRSILSGHGWFTELKDDPTIQEIVDFMANFVGFSEFYKITYTHDYGFSRDINNKAGELKEYLINNCAVSQIS